MPAAPPAETVAAAAAGGDVAQDFQFDASAMADDFAAPLAPEAPAADQPAPTEIAFVDWRVVGQDALPVQRDGMLVVVLDSNQDGVAQISEVLAQHEGVTAVHILAHGDSGEMLLGNGVLDAQAIADGKVAGWGKALTDDGDLLLYGCNVAEGEDGQRFVDQLASATGADVGASTNATGSAARNGDWTLEYTTGALESSPLTADFDYLLRGLSGTTGNDTFTFNASTSSGNTFTWGDTIDGLGTSDTDTLDFSAFGGTLTFTITGAGAVTISDGANSVTATGIEKIIGGSGNDTFVFNAAGSLSSTIAGGSGTDTLDYSGVSSDVTIDVQAMAASKTGGFSGIEVVKGGTGTNTLVGSDGASNTFNFQSNGDVVLGTLTAKNFDVVEGGAGASTANVFMFAATGTFNGSIVGNGLSNTLNYSQRTVGVTVDLTEDSFGATAAGAVAGVSGTVSTDITHVVGSQGNDIITDGGDASVFTDSGGDDTYNFGDDWGGSNTVTDSSGTNTLSFTAATTGVVILFNTSNITVTESTNRLTATGVFGAVRGSSGDDQITAKAGVTVTAEVSGGDGDDRFFVEDFSSDFSGEVDGGDGDDTVDFTLRGGSLSATTDGVLDGFSGGFAVSTIEWVKHPYSIFDGINDLFTSLQDGIDSTIGNINLPLLGNISDPVSSFFSDLRDTLLDPLDAVLLVEYVDGAATKSTVELIEDALSFDFSSEIPSAGSTPTVATFGLTFIGNPNDPDRAEFALVMSGALFDDEWGIDFDAALPGLGLGIEADGAFQLKILYEARIAFGFDFNVNKFYFDTNGISDSSSADDVELKLMLEATVTDGASLKATLGFLQFSATAYDNTTAEFADSDYADDSVESGFFAEFGIDLRDPGADPNNSSWAVNDGILTHSEFKNSNFKLRDNLVAVMEAHADVDLFFVLDGELIASGLPSIQFYLHFDQQYGEAEIKFSGEAEGSGVQAPIVVIEDLSLNLGSFLTDFLNPILQEVQKYTQPLQPVVDFLKADIPILSDIDLLKNLLNKDGEGGVDMLDFAGTLLGNTKYGSVVKAVDALVELIDLVNSIPTDADGILINFGTYTFGGASNDLRTAGSQMAMPNTSGYNSSNSTNPAGASTQTKSFLDKLKRDTDGGGFSVPILTDPKEILNLLTGRTANLVMYDLPKLEFNVSFHKSIPLVFPLNMVLDAGFEVTMQFGFGFDSSGILEFVDGGYNDPELIFKGFYIDDHGVEGTAGDQDEITVKAHFTVGASVGVSGIIEAGVQGGITGQFGFDFNDVDSNGALAGGYDGKIHFHELDDLVRDFGILGFLDMHGSLDWFLEAFVWVGLDLGFFGKITLYDETFDLGGGNIVTFENHYNVSATPDVAHLDNGTLYLHMGSRADMRNDVDSNWSDIDGDGDENFNVDLSKDGLYYEVTYAGVTERFLASSVTKIVGDGAGGKDVLTVGPGAQVDEDTFVALTAGLQFDGGADDDRISYLGTGTAYITGGAGNDRITANSVHHSTGRLTVGSVGTFDTRLEGGDGNDQITVTKVDTAATDGDVYVDGGTGNDRIKTRGGADYIIGGDEGDALTNGKANGDIIDAGAGNDTIYGGTGSDSIKGGDGNDTIYGGDEGAGVTAQGKPLGDVIDGGNGDDTIYGGGGFDTIRGGDGNDNIYGGAGDDSITAGRGVDQVRGEDGNDSINWTVGDGNDSLVQGGNGNDSIVLTGSNVDTVISLTGSSADVIAAWGANSLTLSSFEKFSLNAGTGADIITINDLAATTAKEISIGMGAGIIERTVYDTNNDGVYRAQPEPLRNADGTLKTTINNNGTPGNTADDFQELVYANGTSMTDVLKPMRDQQGNILYTVVNGQQVPVYDDSAVGVQSKEERVTSIDIALDQVIVNGSGIADRFALSSASGTYTIVRQNYTTPASPVSLYSISLTQGDFARDKLTINALDGNDVIDASAIVHPVAQLFLNGGNGNDNVIGSQLADFIDTGAGDDTATGNGGIDTFTDASGTDTLAEVRDSNFDLSDDTIKIGANIATTTEVETVSMFERFDLKGGASVNTLTVHNFDDGKTATLDGAGGGDLYIINLTTTGSSSIVEQDSGGTSGGPDAMRIYGSSGNDTFESTAQTPFSGTIAAVNGSNRQSVRYNVTETLEVHGGDGADVFIVDDSAMEIDFYGEGGADEFNVGRVLSTTTLTDVWLKADGTISDSSDPTAVHYDEVVVADDITNGVSYSARFYGGDGNDYFEVNHNLAEIWLNGEADNDRFVINANLTNDKDSNIAGGAGENKIEYVQNAKVFIDGGTGFDVVVINGTSIADTFIITVVVEDLTDINGNFILDGNGNHVQGQVQKVVGAGLQIGKIANVERLEINGGGGNDQIHVYATLPGMDLIINGGGGDDTIYIAGDGASVTGVTPAHYEQPPTVPAHTIPAYISGYQSFTFDPDPYWYWDWGAWPFYFYYDPAPFTILFPIWQPEVFVPEYTPPKVFVPATPYTFTQADVRDFTGVTGTFTINGDSGNDRIVGDNTGGANTTAARTGTLSQVDIVDGTTTTSYTSLSGFGIAAGQSINITGTETFDLNLGAYDDQLTVTRNDAGMTTTVNLGAGNNTVDLKATTGNFNVIGGSGNDTLNIGSLAPTVTGGTLANVTGAVTFLAGGGSDTLRLDNSGNAVASATTTITGSSISTPGVFGGVSNYTGVETLSVNLGSGADTVNLQGTSSSSVTIDTNGGNDVFNVSSNGATLTGTLDNIAAGTVNLNAGAGNNTLNVSDYGDADADTSVVITSSSITGLAPATINYSATSGRFTGGVNIWAGTGNDVVSITSTTAADVTTFYANGGNDNVTVSNLTGGTNRFLSIHGDAGDDTIDASAITALDFTVLLYGDSGQETYSGTDKQFAALTNVVSTNPAVGGIDTLRGGSGRAILVGGAGGDTLVSKDSNDVLIGDNGSVQILSGVVTQMSSSGTVGGNDNITAAGGSNQIIGGVGDDIITALTGVNDVVFGDNGSATFTSAGVILTAVSSDLGSGGIDSIDVGAGDNVVIGGAAGDTISALGGVDVVIGDNGSATWTSGILTQFKSTDTTAGTGGNDTIDVGEGRNYVIGGVGTDNTTAGAGDDVVLGDNGVVNFTTAGVITDATSTDLGVGGGETLNIGAGNNVVIGGAGGDTITTLGGVDVVIGDNGAATWTAGILTQFKSSDTTAGTGGDDTINVGEGRNYVIGGVGIDNTTAGADDDVVLGDNGIVNFTAAGVITDATSTEVGLGAGETLNVGAGNNVVLAGAGNDSVTALGGTDVVLGDNGAVTWVGGIVTQMRSSDTAAGTGGNDTINVGEGRNYAIGGVGADGITAGAGNDVVLGDNGLVNFTAAGVITDATVTEVGLGDIDTINVGDGDNVVLAGAGGDTVTATGGTDVVIGDSGSVTWVGGVVTQMRSSDTTAGTGGNDTIGVGEGRNYVIGGVGVDGITAGAGDDVVLGDSGIVNFTVAGVITDATVTDEGAGGNDTISVGQGDNVVLAGDGDDSVTALDGEDVVIGDNGQASWTAGVLTYFRSNNTGAGGNDTINVGTTAGVAGKNYVIGGVGLDAITGGENDDVVLGDNGAVNFDAAGVILDATVTEIGIGDVDTIDVRGGDNVVLAGAGGDTVTAMGGTDVVIGDNGQATWTGGVLTQFKSTDAVAGTGGDDTITVGDGNNYVIGGVGVDGITAGTGNDVVLGDSGIVNFTALGVITDATLTTEGTGGADTIDVGAGNNVVLAGDGGDSVTALDGEDVVIGDNGQASWTAGVLTHFRSNNTGAGGNDSINAGTTAAVAGKNYLIGGIGQDSIAGGQNDDVILGDNGAVNFDAAGVILDATVTEVGVGGMDMIAARGGNNVVLAGAGGDTVTALGGIDVIIGDSGQATWTGGVLTQFKSTDSVAATGGVDDISAGDGDNYVIGGVDADTITSGSGNDVVLGDSGIVNFTAAGVITDATVTTEGTGGADTIDVGGGNNVVLAGDGGDTVTALDGQDVVIGDNGLATWTSGVLTHFKSNDTGAGGNDAISVGTIAGVAGKNYVIGGFGADSIIGGQNDDVVLGDNGVVNFDASGNVADATATELGTGGADVIEARGGNNVIVGGAAGDTINSGAGNDTILGDNGNLVFTSGVLTTAVTTDTSDATGGFDTITAGDGINVVLAGVGNDTVTTGAGNDVVIGDNGIAQFNASGALLLVEARNPLLEGDDTIDAGAGDDVVIGGSGADSILGGTGNDVLIGDAGVATFQAGSLIQVVGDSQYGKADVIVGGGGNDILLGGFGDDTLTANLTEDLFTGGNARISFSGGLVTNIELIDGVDLVLQALFDSFSAPESDLDVVIDENVPDGERAGGNGALALSDFGTEGIYASDGTAVMPSGLDSLTFNFGRGIPLAQVPELLRNIVLELSLGTGTPPSGHGDSGSQGAVEGQNEGQGGNPPAGGDAQAGETVGQLPFQVEAEATTLVPQQPATQEEAADASLVLAGALAVAAAVPLPAGRTVQAFDPATGRLVQRSETSSPADADRLDRRAFAPRGIDW